jgi:alpha-galactosidase
VKVVVIGAGSAQFGLQTVAALLGGEALRGGELALVDHHPPALDRMARLADRLDREWGAGVKLSAHDHHGPALADASAVISAIEVAPREALWRSDYDIGLRHGLHQPYAENGGPGGFAHAARNIGPVLAIARAMETACPDAWFVNFSNPMVRICDAIARYSSIRVVGLCHQINAGYGMVGYALADDLGIRIPDGPISTQAHPDHWGQLEALRRAAREHLVIRAAGTNHLTWALEIRHRATGEDWYPRFRERWAALDPAFEPLTRRMFAAFGRFPMTGDSHLAEYLPWVSDPVTRPWETLDLQLYDWDRMAAMRRSGHHEIEAMASAGAPIEGLRDADSEGALEIVESLVGATEHEHDALNVVNDGWITDLPAGAIVEVPGRSTATGVTGQPVGALSEPIAELCRRELTVARLCVDAAVHGDREAALQSLLLGPVVSDLDVARELLDDYLTTYRRYLPQFWDGPPLA